MILQKQVQIFDFEEKSESDPVMEIVPTEDFSTGVFKEWINKQINKE